VSTDSKSENVDVYKTLSKCCAPTICMCHSNHRDNHGHTFAFNLERRAIKNSQFYVLKRIEFRRDPVSTFLLNCTIIRRSIHYRMQSSPAFTVPDFSLISLRSPGVFPGNLFEQLTVGGCEGRMA
jgi:hypothetical protein